MGVGNFTEFDASGPNSRRVLRAVLATSIERKTSWPAGPAEKPEAFFAAVTSSDRESSGRSNASAVGRSELLAIIESSRRVVDEAGGALFCTTETGHVWALITVTSAVSAALKVVEHVALASDAFHIRVAVDLGDVEERAASGRGVVFERVQAQVEKWPGPGIACTHAAASAVGRGSNFDFRSGPIPGTLTPTLL
jgi:hypothetical protein